MTTNRIFPATNGPGASTSFTGSIVQGTVFGVSSACTLQGYYYWRADSSQPGSVTMGLWQLTGQLTGTYLGTATAASNGTMVTGAWNFCPLTTPFTLGTGITYKAVAGQLNNFPFTSNFWTAAITQGPIKAYADTGLTGHDPIWNSPNSSFTTGSSNPAATFPTSANNAYNAWIDILVSTGGGTSLTLAATMNLAGAGPVRLVGRPVAASLSAAAVAARQVGRPVAGSVAVGSSVARQVGRPVAASMVVGPAVTRQIGHPVAALIAVGSSVARQVGRPVAASMVVGPAVTRQIGHPVAALIAVGSSVARRVGKPLAAVLGTVAGWIPRPLVTGFPAVPGYMEPGMATPGKPLPPGSAFALILAAVANLSSGISRRASRLVAAAVTVAGSATSSRARLVIAAATMTTSAATKRGLAVGLAATVAVTSLTRRAVAVAVAAVLHTAATLAAFIPKQITVVYSAGQARWRWAAGAARHTWQTVTSSWRWPSGPTRGGG